MATLATIGEACLALASGLTLASGGEGRCNQCQLRASACRDSSTSLFPVPSHLHIHRLGCRVAWRRARLDPGQTWPLTVAPGTVMARIWGRTNCNFDANGQGQCETGDCNRLLECQGWGSPPNTLAEFALNQPNNLDFLDISLVDGFNIPMDFSPTSGACRGIRCAADINGQCPAELKAPGGCNNPVHGVQDQRVLLHQWARKLWPDYFLPILQG
ncbi:hypothetical protein NL676_011291 [Syzygium grande]|nr:hypothetical protein NL676_011291 [Syzygium grande]